MEIFFINFTNKKINESFFEKILKTTEKTEKIKKGLSLELALMGERGMRNINKKYVGKNKITDVLSFPLSEIKKTSKRELQFVEPPKENSLLGEILLCPSRIKKQAKKKKKDLKEEMAFAFVHGFLHLLGYNHKSTQDTKKMCKKEKEILQSLKIKD